MADRRETVHGRGLLGLVVAPCLRVYLALDRTVLPYFTFSLVTR